MVNYPPYVDAYGLIKELLKKIKEAAVPPKVTNDFIYTKLGLKSTSYRPMIPLLKKLNFINESQTPTQVYRDYRDDSKSKIILAQQVKKAYSNLFEANEYAQKLKKDEIISKLTSLLGTSKDDTKLPKVSSTFIELCNLSDFEHDKPVESEEKEEQSINNVTGPTQTNSRKLGISYTINLNLPPTTDGAVFDAIFKSLKEHLLK